MSKFTFVCEDDAMPFSEGISTKKTFEFESHHLSAILSEFQDFLKGCGFAIDGHLQVTKPEEDFMTELEDILSKNNFDMITTNE